MAAIEHYTSLEALKDAIQSGMCEKSDLLDWEFDEDISNWLEERGEVTIANILRTNFKSANGENVQFAFVLDALGFTADEIKNITKGLFVVSAADTSKKQTVETLSERLEEVERRLSFFERSVVPVGTISLFSDKNRPKGWLPCEGQILSKDFFKKLYLCIGDAIGNEENNSFVLPDLVAHGLIRGVRYFIFTGEQEVPHDKNIVKVPHKRVIKVNGTSFELIHIEVDTSSFYLSKYPVTLDLWQAVMGNASSPIQDDNYSGVKVSLDEYQTFIPNLNNITCLRLSLPSMDEWKMADLRKSELGLCDMNENIKEWFRSDVIAQLLNWNIINCNIISLAGMIFGAQQKMGLKKSNQTLSQNLSGRELRGFRLRLDIST